MRKWRCFRPILLFASDSTSVKLRALQYSDTRIRRKIMAQANPIVPEKLMRLARSTAVRRAALAAVLPFLGVVAAFGIAPDTVTDNVAVKSVVEDVELAAMATPSATDEPF